LTKVIKAAKRMTLNKRISKSNNKTKTTWNIINELLGKQKSMQGTQKLTVDRKQLTNQQDIANAFNNYFSLANSSESNSDNLDNLDCRKFLHTIILNKIRELLFPPPNF
jgi:hypothetical protein